MRVERDHRRLEPGRADRVDDGAVPAVDAVEAADRDRARPRARAPRVHARPSREPRERVLGRDDPLRIGLVDGERADLRAPQRSTQWPPSASAIARTYVPDETSRSSRATPSAYSVELELVDVHRAERASRRRRRGGAACTRARRRSSPPTRPGSAARPRRAARRALPRARHARAARAPRRARPRDRRSTCARVRSISVDVALRQARRTAAAASSPRPSRSEQEARSRTGRASLRGPCARRSRRRTAATIANDVGPAGLSTRTIPLGCERAAAASDRSQPTRPAPRPRGTMNSVISSTERSLEKPAACAVPAAARLARDRAHVDLVDRRAQRHLPRRPAVRGAARE